MTPLQITNLVNSLSNIISCNYSDDELILLSAIFTQIGDTLSTIIAQRQLLDKNNNISN